MMAFYRQYRMLLEALLSDEAIVEENKRTGRKVRIWPGMRTIELDLSHGLLPTCDMRKTHPHVAAAENAWCLRGDNNLGWLSKHTKVWNAFTDLDLLTYNFATREFDLPTLWEAYGFRWKFAFGRDQLADALAALTVDPSNRRIWISSWHPGEDGLMRTNQKTVPCPVGFTLHVMGGQLYSTYVLRSSDTFLGLPHDIMRHAFLMDACAVTLNVGVGVMSFAIANSHLYDKHWELAKESLTKPLVPSSIYLPSWSVSKILDDPDAYVEYIKTVSLQAAWPAWNPPVDLIL